MANESKSITKAFDTLPKLLRLIIIIIGGVLVGGIYRLIKWYENRNTATLVAGLLVTFTFVGNIVVWIIDIVTTVTNDRITVFAD